MEDMISKIIDMDKKARSLTDEAQKSKLDFEKDILQKKEQIKNDYLARALSESEVCELRAADCCSGLLTMMCWRLSALTVSATCGAGASSS